MIHEKYMRRALALARCGLLSTSPNPMVGAVIVNSQGEIIGEGYHRRYGEAHAEVNAIASVAREEDLLHSTMYVSLEPCAHYGKTPPCAKLIIDKKIPRVVVGTRDPFDKVDGRGIDMMREAGVEVIEGMLERECRALNVAFFTAHTHKRPFVVLKWARSADGFLDVKRGPDEHAAKISTPLTAKLMHRLRSYCNAVMVGSGTIIADNPHLNTRYWPGKSPRPVVLDRRGRIDDKYDILQRNPVIINDDKPLPEILRDLYDMGMISLLVEGGSKVLQSFIDLGIWDLARVEIGPVRFGEYGAAPAPIISGLEPVKIFDFDGQIIKYYSQNDLVDVKNL